MAPIAVSGLGFLLVLLQIRIDGFDLANDTVGWVLMAYALLRLATFSRCFTGAGVVAVLGGLLSVLGYLPVEAPSQRVGQLLLTVALVLAALGVSARAERAQDGSVRRQGRMIAWLTGVAAAAGALFGWAANTGYGELVPAAVLSAVVSFVAAVWFVVLQLFLGRRSYLRPDRSTPDRVA